MHRPHAVPVALGPALVLALAAAAAADTVTLKDRTTIDGKVLSQDDQQVVINPYNSLLPKMEWGVKTLQRKDVAKVEITPPDPLREYWEKSSVAQPDRKALLAFCREHGFDAEAKEEAAWLLAAEPQNADARRVLGETAAAALLRSDPRHNAELRAKVVEYARLREKERKPVYEQWQKEYGVTLPQAYFDRVARSLVLPKGLQTDVTLTWQSRRMTGRYTVWVPDDYDPHRAYPLLVALHGTWNGKGGPGNGPDFMPHFQPDARRFGWIVVCPTADPLPWNARGDSFVLWIVEEMQLLYNVDLNRVYLIGHSRGGMGTWHFGTAHTDRWAAIAPAAGVGGGFAPRVAEAGCGIYAYHSGDDPEVPCSDDRVAAQALAKAKAEFVYTEYTNAAHGWPREVIDDQLLYFRRHHKMARAAKGAKGPGLVPVHGARPSFEEPLLPDEYLYFPQEPPDADPSLEKRLAAISLGGTRGAKAADAIIKEVDKAAVAPLGKILQNPKELEDARLQAARALGAFREPAAVAALARGLADKSLKVRRVVVEAYGKVAEAKDGPPLVAALDALGKEWDDARKHGMVADQWEGLHAVNAALVVALGAFGEAKAAPAVAAVAVRKVLLSEGSPKFDFGYDGEPARRRAAIAIATALPGFREPKLKAEAEAIAVRFAADPAVKHAADEAAGKF